MRALESRVRTQSHLLPTVPQSQESRIASQAAKRLKTSLLCGEHPSRLVVCFSHHPVNGSYKGDLEFISKIHLWDRRINTRPLYHFARLMVAKSYQCGKAERGSRLLKQPFRCKRPCHPLITPWPTAPSSPESSVGS